MDEDAEIPAALLKCCIHTPGAEGKVKLFSNETLKKCHDILRARIYHRLNAREFTLPEKADSLLGYHPQCYSKFTSIKSHYLTSLPSAVRNAPFPQLNLPSPVTSALPSTSSDNHGLQAPRPRRVQPKSRTGVLQKVCIFCHKSYVTHNFKKQLLLKCATKNFERRVRDAAISLSDFTMLAFVGTEDFVSKEVHYHKICCSRYLARARRTAANTASRDWFVHRQHISQAFHYIFSFVREHVIDKDEVFTSKELFEMYTQAFQEISPQTSINEISSYRLDRFEQKIMCHFPRQILIDKRSADVHILFHSSMDYHQTVVDRKLEEMKQNSLLRNAAFLLRKIILSTEKSPLPTELSVPEILKGECEVPSQVIDFFKDVIKGPTTNDTDATQRRAVSMAQDLIFSASRGRLKPTKHLSLGITMKSLTGSKKVVDVLNRLGHSSSYSTIEEVETELSYSSLNQNSYLPSNIVPSNNLCTMVAFNNFDRFVDTATGKDTLHDTVAVVYQNDVDLSTNAQHTLPDVSEPKRKRRRRAFDELLGEVVPYSKKPNKPFEIRQNFPLINKGEGNKDYYSTDMIWAASMAHDVPQTPMWVGFNSQLFSDNLPVQKVAYLPQINQSPTSYSVVAHTLKVALIVAELCEQTGIVCGYDLNIARMALQIQNQESPQYDDVIIMFGPFHIELSFFKALGKYLDGSGVMDILEDLEFIAGGSVNGLIGGTHYNRCKRIYQLLALAMRTLHYRQFYSQYCDEKKYTDGACRDDPGNADPDGEAQFKSTIQDQSKGSSLSDPETVSGTYMDESQLKRLLEETKNLRFSSNDEVEFNPLLQQYIDEYRKYEEITLRGGHGATAQFWILFVRLFDLYHDFTRSVRMGQIYEFLKSLRAVTDFFFAVNHHNYARWLVVFADKLADALERNDDVGEQLRKGIFSVRRTNKNFSRSGVDLTLEQTTNADAGNKMSGISSFTNSISARQRWAVTHSQRTEITSRMMESVGLSKKEDVTRDLIPSNISAGKERFEKLTEGIQNFMNPFLPNLDESKLFNICTGKSAKEETKNFLLQLMSAGKLQHENFRKECSMNSGRFSQPIKRNNILNFASENQRLRVKHKDTEKVLKQERNLFARLLAVSLEKKIDLRNVLAYPITPVPLSLCHSDGTKLSTPKSVLLHYLEKLSDHDEPCKADVTIIDGFYFIHSIAKLLPSTYGQIAHALLKKFLSMKNRIIHLVFDKYVSPSIKDIERSSRAGTSADRTTSFTIENPSQKRATDLTKLLKMDNFKEALVEFFIREWQKPEYLPYFKEFTLYVNKHNTCFQFYHQNEKVVITEAPAYNNSHMEADSKIAFIITRLRNSNVIVKTSDTDILVIILGNIHHVDDSVHVWLETGTYSRNSRRFININKIATVLGASMCKALTALHALTGSDYTASFHRLGKIKPLKVVLGNHQFQDFLAQNGDNYILTDTEKLQMEKLVCSFYSKKSLSDVDELRLQIFMDTFKKPTKKSQPLMVKGIDASQFPPCKKVLHVKSLRTKFVTLMWNSVSLPDPPALSPIEFGWTLNEQSNAYEILWFTGPALPPTMEEVICSENLLMQENEANTDSPTDESDDSEPEDEDW